MRLHFKSCHHPSVNGQVERVNSTLEQHLQVHCNYEQDNWSTLLPPADLAYNNAPYSTTGVSPFFATGRYDPPRQGDQPDPYGCAADVGRS
jgi:hypothetical protein